ncbi:uncharacterized protein LOC114916657 [Cajanus cajan]|uniref:uncharacterized protein LOC114916657 n=1 Tax=Cajanus cajan TaxID=3821 RepID=UPI0010FB4DA0|nr:uncharacterized protein LOC114916657 [Cajanus cajan]
MGRLIRIRDGSKDYGDAPTPKSLDSTSPFSLHPSDGPHIIICPIVLHGENYNATLHCGGKGGHGQVAHAATTLKPFAQAPIQDSDRRGIPSLLDDQWAMLVHILNTSKGKSSSIEKLSGSCFDDSDCCG